MRDSLVRLGSGPVRRVGRRAALGCCMTAAAAVACGGAALAQPAAGAAQPRACAPPTPPTVDQGAPSSALLSRLAVLRRPRVAQDTLPVGPGMEALPMVGEGIYVNYIRYATSLGGTSYYLVPVQRALKVRGCPSSEEVFLVTVEPGGFRGFSGVTAQQLVAGRSDGTRWLQGHSVVYGIVPDGVARVVIRYATGHGRHVKVAATPTNNVFAVAVPAGIASSVLPVVPSSLQWRAPSGRVIKTIHTGG